MLQNHSYNSGLFQKVSNDLIKLIKSAGFADVSMETLLRQRPSKKLQSSSVTAGDVLNISQTDSSSSISAVHLSPALVAVLKAVLTAGLYPNIARVTSRSSIESTAMGVKETCVAQTQYGLVHAHPSSVNRFLPGPGWLIFHEKVCVGMLPVGMITAIFAAATRVGSNK